MLIVDLKFGLFSIAWSLQNVSVGYEDAAVITDSNWVKEECGNNR